MSKELEKFDPVYSMAETVRLVGEALARIDTDKKLTKQQERLIELVEDKMKVAEEWYERPLDSPEVYDKLARIELARGERRKAGQYHKKMALFEANNVEFLGRQQEFFGNGREALRHYEKALELAPDHPLAQPGRDKTLLALDKAERGLARLREKTEEKKDDTKAWLDLGAALLQTGDAAAAMKPLERAVKLDPQDVKALCKLGCAFASQGKFEDALPYFEKALEIHPTSNTAKRGKSYALFNLGRLE